MAYNLGSVRQNVFNRLDDEDFDREYLDRAINYTIWQITNKHQLSILETSTLLTLNAGDVEVSLPSDHHETLFLRVSSPTDKRADLTNNYTNYADFIRNYISPADNTPSMPYYWSEFGRKLKFAAPADEPYSLPLDYLKLAAKLVDDEDVPIIPEEFSELLELGAYMRVAKREDDYDVKGAEQGDYTALLLDFLHVYGRKKEPGGNRTMRVRGR